jgi:carboxyl-terminal processing protease
LWTQAKFGFANFWNVPGLDWDATYKSYLPQALATKTTAEYYKVLLRFYALLHDGHTGVYEPDELRQYRIPIMSRLIDGRVLVTGSLDPKLDMQGVKPGDEVLQVNDLPVKEYAEKSVLPYMTSSSPQDREARTYGTYLFEGYAGTLFHVVVETPEGKQSKHDFVVPAKFFSPDEAFEFRMLPGNVAYVALNEFNDDKDAEEWDKHWPEISKAKTVILDMRRNGGGGDNVGAHVLSTLLDKPVALPRQESPEWIATYRAWGQAEPMHRYPAANLPPDPAHHFAGKVVMLIGPQTFSAAEDLVVVFATSKRGVIVGEATAGSTGQPLMFDLPGGGLARVCTKHDSFPDGHEFVGVGVPPDVVVHLTRKDLVRGTDSVLDTGLKVALQP